MPVAQRDPRLAHQRSGEVIEDLVHLAPAGQGLHVFEPALKPGIGFVTRADQGTDVDDLCCEVVGDADPVAAQIGTKSERLVIEDAEGAASLVAAPLHRGVLRTLGKLQSVLEPGEADDSDVEPDA